MRGGAIRLNPPNIKDLIATPYEHQDDYLDKWYGRQIRDLSDSGFVILGFSLKHGIPVQIKQAKDKLEALLEHEKNENPDAIYMERPNIPNQPDTLLRVIDADNEGYSTCEIGQRIYIIEDEVEAQQIAKERLKNARLYWSKL